MSVSLVKPAANYADLVTVTVESVKRTNGIAGQFAMTATVHYTFPDAPDSTHQTVFVGSVYGGAPVMVDSDGRQTHVTDAGRFGEFAADPASWVRSFYA